MSFCFSVSVKRWPRQLAAGDRRTGRRHRDAFLAAGLALWFAAAPLGATCGGGGGGGTGGTGIGGALSAEPNVYQVPWTVILPGRPEPQGPLAVYWFPRGPEEARRSPLQNSRSLSLASGRCVDLAIVPSDRADLRDRFQVATDALPLALLVTGDGQELGRALPTAGKEAAILAQIEKQVQAALRGREKAMAQVLDEATAREKAGDTSAATGAYRRVWDDRCVDPSAGRKAAKALKRLGVAVEDKAADASLEARPGALPRLGDDSLDAAMTALLEAGLAAENGQRYEEARAHYAGAHRLEPGDAVALRHLGELERHHTGDWLEATRHFEAILAGPADPISRAVALHGLGKMTIHADRFAEGLALIERSVETWPLPLAYRNLAVYWNSEGQMAKAQGYAEQALALDPADPYNLVFMAVFLAEDGRRAAALAAARENENLLEASYNLAVIHTLAGDPAKGLELLRRHFYDYERYDAVRAKEMREAREDIGFLDLRQDPAFLELTRMAEDPRFSWRGSVSRPALMPTPSPTPTTGGR